MPVAHIHLVADSYPGDRLAEFQSGVTSLYSEVLGSPADRIRVYVLEYPPGHVLVGGEPVRSSADAAPYFTVRVLAGRPEAQGRRLLAGVTDLLVDVLGYDRPLVRGELVELDPRHWSIGGRTAAEVRAEEIRAREDAGD